MKRLFANQSLLLRLSLLPPLLLPLIYSLQFLRLPSKQSPMPTTTTTEILGVEIHRNPPQSTLSQLGVQTWPTWEGEPSKIPWSFKSRETMYLLKGKVKVTIDGHGDDESFEIGGGDLVVFPKGMVITWEVVEAVKKHYNFEKEK